MDLSHLISLAKQFQSLLGWLCPPSLDPEADQEQLREMCAPLTASWIRRHELFEKWLDLTGSSLWMRGNCTIKHLATSTNVVDGTGKTFLV